MKEKVTYLLIFSYLILSPYWVIFDTNFYDTKRLLQIVLLSIVGMILFFYSKGQKNESTVQNSLSQRLLLIFFIIGVVSSFLSESLKYSLIEVTFFAALCSMILLIKPVYLSHRYFLGKTIFVTALLYSGFYIIIFFVNYGLSFNDNLIPLWPSISNFSFIIDGYEFKSRNVLFFENRRIFNHTQTIVFPILIGLLSYSKQIKLDPKIRALLFVLISCWWMLTLASGSRGTIISVISPLLFIGILWKKEIFNFVKITFSSVITGSALYYILFKVIPKAESGITVLRSSDTNRFTLWGKALNHWLDNPLLGIGPMQFAKLKGEPFYASPHNFYLQILSEWGLFAFLLLIGILFLVLKRFYFDLTEIKRSKRNRIIYISIVWSFLALLVDANFGGTLNTPIVQIWFVLIVTWLVSQDHINQSIKYRRYAKIKYVYIILITIMLYLNYDDIVGLSERYNEYMINYPESGYYPRFWKQGLIE